jgi:hypothetical protein
VETTREHTTDAATFVRMRLAPAIALTATAMFALAACQPDATPIVPTPAPSTSPIFTSDEEALAAAADAYRAFQETSDQILRDGGENPERLKEFVTDEVYEKEAAGYAEAKKNGWHQTGETVIPEVTLESYSPSSAADGTVIAIYVCTDISATDVVDKAGSSIVKPGRPSHFPFQAAFQISAQGDRLVLSSNEIWTGGGFCDGPPLP